MDVSPGYFSAIDTVHVHVDGGGESAPVELIVNQLREQGCPGKTTPIREALAGRQREESWAISTYESHTPGPAGREHLEYFSTSLLLENLQDMQIAINRLNSILTMLQQANIPEGIVVEAERVIAQGEDTIIWSDIPVDDSLTIRSAQVGFDRSRTADIEIHYAFDIPKKGKWLNQAPITLKELKNACDQLGLFVGGWFFFEKEDKWAYRSNQFARAPVKERVQEQRDKLNDYLTRKGKELVFECKVRALIEQILGVWRTPLTVVDQEMKKNTRQLAQWEASRQLEEFWVIAPNFLGDTRGDVRQAMITNLRKRVCYTYFLRSFADVQRLRKLTELLKPDIDGYADIFNYMKAVVLESGLDKDFFEDEYFIAYADQNSKDGYRLLRTAKGQVYAGERMTASDFRKTDLLRNLLQQSQVNHWMQIPLRRDSERLKQKAIVCVYLNPICGERPMQSEFEPEISSNEFDPMVAENVSKLYGEVVKGSSSSYFLFFDTAEAALTCASRLQNTVREHNKPLLNLRLVPPRIAVDFGLVRRVLRSYGFDYSGMPVSVSGKLVDKANDGKILFTKAIEDNLPPASKGQFRIVRPTTMALGECGSVECRTLDWE